MKDLYIIGAGGFGREVAWLVERINDVTPIWNLKGFIDDNESLWGTEEGKHIVLGGCDYLKSLGEVYAVCAIGNAKVRKNVVAKLSDSQVRFATLIDPSVIMSKRVEVGKGVIICAGTIATVDIRIGNHVIINLDCTIGHDAILNDFVTLYPSVNISGITNIGHAVELGTGMQIIQGKSIGDYSIVGAGAVVVKDIPEKCTAVGNPARVIRYDEFI